MNIKDHLFSGVIVRQLPGKEVEVIINDPRYRVHYTKRQGVHTIDVQDNKGEIQTVVVERSKPDEIINVSNNTYIKVGVEVEYENFSLSIISIKVMFRAKEPTLIDDYSIATFPSVKESGAETIMISRVDLLGDGDVYVEKY